MRLLPCVAMVCFAGGALAATEPTAKPNVIIVLTDDQGYGDLSCHGNPVLKTPHLDRLHSQSVRLTDFHVAPMCTPTRGQLISGVDCLRNGAMNVSSGRVFLRRELPTMADVFAGGGYRCGQFGKWHLGDNYPYRPPDRGFHEALYYPSSHIGSAPDAWNNDYFDDTYYHNGRREKFQGYTTDVFFTEAMKWMRAQAAVKRPFFCYLPTAAAHGPLYVPKKYRDLYKDQKPNVASFFGMIANIDENMDRLEQFLIETGLRHNTILIFMTDNGGTVGVPVFNAGMKGAKVTLWEGGHRVPCFFRWPVGRLRPPGDVAELTQVQDILPTLIDLCGLPTPVGARFDGTSLAKLLRGEVESLPDRMFVINYSRMSGPVPKREGAAVLWKRWRLLENRELYDLTTDPLQTQNVIGKFPKVVAKMRAHLDVWWREVEPGINDFGAVILGNDRENPCQLSPSDWQGAFLDQGKQVREGLRRNGAWNVVVEQAGDYEIELRRWPREADAPLAAGIPETQLTDAVLPPGAALPIAQARLKVGPLDQRVAVEPNARQVVFRTRLTAGRTQLQTWFYDAAGGEICGAYYVYVTKVGASGASRAKVRLIVDIDMSGDCDDAGALALLNALADLGECDLLAVVTNRKDLTNSSAAAVDAINTYYGRPDIPIGSDKVGPTALQRTSPYAAVLRSEFPNDIGPDDRAPDALDVYRRVLGEQSDGSVTICSVGALSNLAELARQSPDLVRAKVQRLVVMGGEFPCRFVPETNIRTHAEAARVVAERWPGEVVWHGFEVGNVLITGSRLKNTPAGNPVRRAYELRRYKNRPSIDGGQPSYDQAAALFAVRGPQPEFWEVVGGGRVRVDQQAVVLWDADPSSQHRYVKIKGNPQSLADEIERLMIRRPAAAPPR